MSEQIWLAFNFGGNHYDVTNCTEKFKLKRGMLYAPDTLEATLYTPIVAANGVTMTWGGNLTYAAEVRVVIFGSSLFHGTIESWEVEGDRVHIKAIQAADRFLKSGYTGTITNANQATAIKAIATAMGMTVYNNFAPFTPATINSVSFHGMRLRDVFKRLCEFTDPANRKLQVMAVFEPSSSGAELGDTGGVDATDVPISQSTRLISVPKWSDGRDRVVNHVIVKYRTGEVSAEDATSIAAHTRRTTTLYRPEILSPVDAQNVADTILYFLKDPAESCRCKVALDDPLVRHRMAGLTTFRVIDEISGKDKNMIIREIVFSFPDLTADVWFDTIGLSTEEYQATADARIATLEATQPDQELNSDSSPTFDDATINGLTLSGTVDQGVKTTDSPTFAGLTLSATVPSILSANADGRLKINISGRIMQLGCTNADYCYIIAPGNAGLAVNNNLLLYRAGYNNIGNTTYPVGNLYLNGNIYQNGNLFCDSSRNITCGSITPSSINVHDLGSQTNYWNESFVNCMFATSIRSMTDATDEQVQLAQRSSHVWFRCRMSGASLKSGIDFSSYDTQHFFMYSSGGDLKIDHNTTLDSAGAVNKLTLSNGGSLTATGALQGSSLVLPGTINSTITNENNTGAIRIDAGSNGYVTVGPQNNSACHIYTDRAYFAFNKTIFTVDSAGDLGTSTYKWRSLYLNGSIYNAGNLVLDASRNLTLGSGSITTTGNASINSLFASNDVNISNDLWMNSGGIANIYTIRFGGVGDATLGRVNSTTIGIGATTNFTQGGLRWLGEGRRIYGTSYPFNCTASTNWRNDHLAEKTYTWLTTYQKQKTITMQNGIGPGTYRVYFEIAANTTVGVVYGRVYKNGVAIGTARSKTGNTYTGYTEDFSGPLEPGDTIELWCYQNGGDGKGGKCRNFRIGYDLGLPTTMPSANS